MSKIENKKRILALDVRPQRLGFAVFEGPDCLLDWGAKSFPSGAKAVRVPAGRKLAELLDEFAPAAVALRKRTARRTKKYLRMTGLVEREAGKRRIPLRFVTRSMVKKAFAGHERNKHEIATALAARFPELAPKLPPKRKCWQSEDYRIHLFDAAALGLAYFSRYAKKVGSGSVDNSAPSPPA
jgi:hypothetical protein